MASISFRQLADILQEIRTAPIPDYLEDERCLVITVLRVTHDYDHARVRDLHIRIQRDFGKINERWGFRVMNDSGDGTPQYDMEYWFMDARDATLFALKYSGEGFSIDQ